MPRVSVLIPARNEKHLVPTVKSLLDGGGDVEVIAVLDGYWEAGLPADKRLKIIHRGAPRGMRDGINSAAAIAQGDYLMKIDAHCLVASGYDETLAAECADNWIVIPRRYSLNADTWTRNEGKEPEDAMHYFYPYAHPEDLGLHGRPWPQKARGRKDILLDEDVTFQGSCWFMHRDHFHKRLHGMDERGYETFMGEPQEIGLKTQLGPWQGLVMRNKKTWYAHLHKGKSDWKVHEDKSGRIASSERARGNAYSFDFWWNNRWSERVHDFDWLVDKYGPFPGWPVDWRNR